MSNKVEFQHAAQCPSSELLIQFWLRYVSSNSTPPPLPQVDCDSWPFRYRIDRSSFNQPPALTSVTASTTLDYRTVVGRLLGEMKWTWPFTDDDDAAEQTTFSASCKAMLSSVLCWNTHSPNIRWDTGRVLCNFRIIRLRFVVSGKLSKYPNTQCPLKSTFPITPRWSGRGWGGGWFLGIFAREYGIDLFYYCQWTISIQTLD